jgi:hypothetical protein
MVDVPLATAITTPPDTVAAAGLVLLQVPYKDVFVSVEVAPAQIAAVPLIADGVVVTDIIAVALHPVANE